MWLKAFKIRLIEEILHHLGCLKLYGIIIILGGERFCSSTVCFCPNNSAINFFLMFFFWHSHVESSKVPSSKVFLKKKTQGTPRFEAFFLIFQVHLGQWRSNSGFGERRFFFPSCFVSVADMMHSRPISSLCFRPSTRLTLAGALATCRAMTRHTQDPVIQERGCDVFQGARFQWKRKG